MSALATIETLLEKSHRSKEEDDRLKRLLEMSHPVGNILEICGFGHVLSKTNGHYDLESSAKLFNCSIEFEKEINDSDDEPTEESVIGMYYVTKDATFLNMFAEAAIHRKNAERIYFTRPQILQVYEKYSMLFDKDRRQDDRRKHFFLYRNKIKHKTSVFIFEYDGDKFKRDILPLSDSRVWSGLNRNILFLKI